MEGISGLGVLSLDTGHATLVNGSASPNAIGSGGTGGMGDMLSAAHSFDPFLMFVAALAEVEDLAGRAVAVRETEEPPLTLVPRVDPVIAREEVAERWEVVEIVRVRVVREEVAERDERVRCRTPDGLRFSFLVAFGRSSKLSTLTEELLEKMTGR